MEPKEPVPQLNTRFGNFSQPITLDDYLNRGSKNFTEYEIDQSDKERLNKIFERVKEKFSLKVLDSIDKKQIKISKNRFLDRLNKINITYFDSAKKQVGGGALGGFSVNGFRFYMDIQMLNKPEIQQDRIIYHELTHAVINGFSFSKFEVVKNVDISEINKDGIRYNDPIDKNEPDRNRQLKNEPINEAVTETIALMLLSDSDLRDWQLQADGTYLQDIDNHIDMGSPAYPFERSLLARLVFKNNIPWTLFLDAYTEETDEIYGQKINELNSLLKQIKNERLLQ